MEPYPFGTPTLPLTPTGEWQETRWRLKRHFGSTVCSHHECCPSPTGALLTSAEVSSTNPTRVASATNGSPRAPYEWRATLNLKPPFKLGRLEAAGLIRRRRQAMLENSLRCFRWALTKDVRGTDPECAMIYLSE